MAVRALGEGPTTMDYLGQAGGIARQLGQEYEAREQRERPLHPDIQSMMRQAMARIQAGEDPRAVAIETKLAFQGGGSPAPPSGPGGPPGAPPPALSSPPGAAGGLRVPVPQGRYDLLGAGREPALAGRYDMLGTTPPPQLSSLAAGQPMMSGPVISRQVASPSSMQAGEAGVKRPPPDVARPFTRADLGDFDTVMGSTAKRDIAELNARVRQEEGGARRGSQEKIAGAREANRMAIHEDNFDLANRRLEQDWKKALLAAQTAMSKAREGRATSKDIASMRALLSFGSQINAQMSANARATNELGGQFGTSTQLSSRMDALDAQYKAFEPQIRMAIQEAEQHMKQVPSPMGSAVPGTPTAPTGKPQPLTPDELLRKARGGL